MTLSFCYRGDGETVATCKSNDNKIEDIFSKYWHDSCLIPEILICLYLFIKHRCRLFKTRKIKIKVREAFKIERKKNIIIITLFFLFWRLPLCSYNLASKWKNRNSLYYSSKRLKMSSLCYYLKRLKMTGLCYSIKGLQMISHFSPKLVNRQLENDQSWLVDKT